MIKNPERVKLAFLLEMVEKIAITKYDGHFTIMRFTTHWKGMYGTPECDSSNREQIKKLFNFPTIESCLKHLVVQGLDEDRDT